MTLRNPEKPAILYEDQVITYTEFHRNICQIQQHLLSLKRESNPQKVAILIGNEPAFLELYFAVITLGWIAIPFDPKWSKREFVGIMQTAEPDIIITSKHFPRSLSTIFEKSYEIETLKKPSPNKMVCEWNENSNKPFYLGFTSGSTGTPKGFIRNHESWLTSFAVAENVFQYNQEDIMLAPGPLCHSLSLFAATHALHIGATFQLTATFNPEVLNDSEATVVYAVPTMIHRFLQQTVYPIQKRITFLLSGAKLHPELRTKLQHSFPNSVVYEYFGASELSFITYASNAVTQQHPDSVGKPFPSVKITIRDQEMQQVPNGEIGEIFIESDFLFTGYVNNPEETSNVLTKHGATVGDLGFIDDTGILTVIGRKKNMLISGGLNIYPEEVEKVMKEIESVQELVVIGVTDDYWGQKAIALVKWKHQAELEKLKAHCKTHLATYKCPKEFHEVDHFPYTSTGKISRKDVELQIARYTS